MELAALLDALSAADAPLIGRGIEKESLRVAPDGGLSERPHPSSLGSALKHPRITTDFSESQLELITGVHASADAAMRELTDVHRFVHAELADELVWPSSMPCMVSSGSTIPLGNYGSSNIGQAKRIYRQGLANRYGALMQTISGIHYNFSLSDDAWRVIDQVRGAPADRTAAYLGLIRNFRRYSWLLLYLFGASPAVCKTFTRDLPHNLESFDDGTHYLPYATCLRMGRLGYQSDAQKTLHISYNDLDAYAATMRHALTTPWPEYEAIGLRDEAGGYRQLNTSLLQIENEFYGTIRPKRTIRTGERPLTALTGRGVEYVEVRCMDLNPWLPAGIDPETMRFLDTFLIACLLTDSAADTEAESAEMQANQMAVVERGREPGLLLQHNGEARSLTDWADALLNFGEPVARALDSHDGISPDSVDSHWQALQSQRRKVADAALTPSARIIDAMQNNAEPFFRVTMNLALAHREHFASTPPTATEHSHWRQQANDSLRAQHEAEAAETESFEDFLERYLQLP